MQIKKINNNKLKIILSLTDLNEKNIDIDSFLANSVESQDLFFEILDLAQEEYNFNIENHKAIVEAISLDNNIFILTITKLKNETLNTYNILPKIYKFENINDFLNLYSFINKNDFNNIEIYYFLNNYYFILNNSNYYLENILCEYSNCIYNSEFSKDILIEYGKKINIGN